MTQWKNATLAAALLALTGACAQEKPEPMDFGKLTPSQREGFERAVRDYLLRNPQVLAEVQQAYQQKMETERAERAQKALATQRPALYEDAGSPVAGNPRGDVTVVEFFDYRCPYCKRALPSMEALMARDPQVRLIFKELPILGVESVGAARAALAAHRQGQYVEFHKRLMASPDVNEAAVKAIAGQLKLDFARLQADMKHPEVEQAIQRSLRLAEALEINGTPAFVVGNRIIPGAVDGETLIAYVAQERERQRAGKP